ncbi:MAG: FAD:protein FMN transferase [Proteobacteria bacterium]|nr:FAD:protein FMN transferase [Pseudomonadota bacterium]
MIRARPLLGTRVDIRVENADTDAANAAIDRGFAAIAEVHRLMSFHEAASDVSRLNREATASAVRVDAHTFNVLRFAQDFSEGSDGIFDITTAGRLVAWGFLPRPPGAPEPDPEASWRDVILEGENRIRFAKPLWIDLGGIAKGYAIDQALAAMDLAPGIQAVVNAGGDLRVAGPRIESIHLRSAIEMDEVPVVEIEDGALACSSGREHLKIRADGAVGPHVHGRNGRSVGADSFVAVAARDCLTADALTKVVLTAGSEAEAILGQCGAIAYFYEAGAGWRTVGAAQD